MFVRCVRTRLVPLPDEASVVAKAFSYVPVEAVECKIGCATLEPAVTHWPIAHIKVVCHVVGFPLQNKHDRWRTAWDAVLCAYIPWWCEVRCTPCLPM
jgi:hypothetical protein